MKKIILSLIIVIFGIIFLLNISYGEENNCNYTAKINQCINEKNKRTIENFVCIEGSREEITYQIVLDEKFNEIDLEVDGYLINLEIKKDKYFGPNAESNYIEAIDEIEAKFSIWGEYWKKYFNACGIEIIKEVQSCKNGESSISNASDYFKKSTCMNMARAKLYIYRQVAYDILMLNKLSVRQDSSKEHLQEERIKYDEVLNSMMINSGYMERISKKWPSKLKNTHQ